MTHISKGTLSDAEFTKLFDQLSEILSKLDKRGSASFLTAVLTPAEKVMVTKRVAAIIMLHEKYSMYKIWTLLKISSSTAKIYALQYEQGVYDDFILQLKKRHNNVWADIERYIDFIIEPMEKNRWKYLK